MKKKIAIGLVIALAMMCFSNYVGKERKARAITIYSGEYTVGSADRTSAFWTAFSESYKIEDESTITLTFDCFGSNSALWRNFVMVFSNQRDCRNDTRGENYVEYACVRTDKYGWSNVDDQVRANISLNGDTIVHNPPNFAMSDENWKEFTEIMMGANVTLQISRKGATIHAVIKAESKTDPSKVYNSISTIQLGKKDANGNVIDNGTGNAYITLAADNSYLVVKQVELEEYKYVEPTATPIVSSTVTQVTGTNTTSSSGSLNSENTWKSQNKTQYSTSSVIAIKRGTKFTKGKLKYKVTKSQGKKGEIAVQGVTSQKVKSLTIPKTIKKNGITLKVTSIASKAFYKCKKLKKLAIKSKTIKKIGKKAFRGTHKKLKISVPYVKIKRYSKMIRRAR